MKRQNGNNRLDRVNEELKREIGNIINNELKNSNITGLISVTKVKISPDLKHAKVYVSMINSKSVKNTLAGLKRASGYIRSMIAQRINLRVTPELVFILDDSMEYGEKIDNILKEIIPNISNEEMNLDITDDKGNE
jgi:ribosome-binding factor A